MIDKQVEKLRALNEKARTPSSGGNNRGGSFARYERRPDYTKPAIGSSRPRSDRGVTFHFKHTFVSKKNSISTGYRNETSASAHQDYIERRGAAEEVADADGQPRPLSFGTIGETKAERSEFWRKVEQSEGKKARVQCRMIVELPHELDGPGRERLAGDFCKLLEDEGMPYWCVVHAPDKKNDSRNHHMHIAYFDRPAARTDDGSWDFEITQEVKGKNRVKRTVRPLKQNKPRHAQGATWIRRLRRGYADVANAHLSVAGEKKRYDPRSYNDSGVPKSPTLHMGTKRAHAESQGLDTKAGGINARREMSYRLASEETSFMSRAARMAYRAESYQATKEQHPRVSPQADEAAQLCRQHETLSREAVQVSRKKATHDLAAEAVTGRIDRRIAFLGKEADRLLMAPPKAREDDAIDASAALYQEYDVARDTRTTIAPFAIDCNRVSQTQERRLSGIQREQIRIEKRLDQLDRQILERLTPASHDYGLDELVEATTLARDIRGTTPADPTRDGQPSQETLAPDQTPSRGEQGLGLVEDMPLPAGQPTEQNATHEDTTTIADDMRRAYRSRDADDAAGQASTAPPLQGLFARSTDRADDPSPTNTQQNDTPPSASTDKFADAMRLTPDATAEQLLRFEKKLLPLANADLRRIAFATRDASDFEAEPLARRENAAALTAIRRHAARRGLDLDSGIHDPERASDPDLARRHTDTVRPMSGHRWWDPTSRTRT